MFDYSGSLKGFEMYKLLLTKITNEIHIVRFTEEGDGTWCQRGSGVDMTDDALRAVFRWFVRQIENDKEQKGRWHIRYGDLPYVLEMRRLETTK